MRRWWMRTGVCSVMMRHVRKVVRRGIDVPKFIKQITTDNFGVPRIRSSTQISWVAAAPGSVPVEKLCEGACVYNLMEEAPIPIARLQRYSTEKAMAAHWAVFQRAAPTGKRVAVVGAGPAGLSVRACAGAGGCGRDDL